eukprot:gene1254-2428_t
MTEFKRDKAMAEQQTKQHFDTNQIFYYGGDDTRLSKLQEMLQRNNKAIDDRDAGGASVIHVSYIREQKIIQRWLVENYPEDALLLYSNDKPYAGENIMHIAIAKRDADEVQWLLNYYDNKNKDNYIDSLKKLLYAQTMGCFFQPGGHCYFGEYPILFAVCSGETKIVDYLIEKSPDWDYIFKADSH